jgi:hypothetical protein
MAAEGHGRPGRADDTEHQSGGDTYEQQTHLAGTSLHLLTSRRPVGSLAGGRTD